MLWILPGYHNEGEPIMLTEFGGISYRPGANSAWFGYGTVTSSEAFLVKYKDLIDAIWIVLRLLAFAILN